jgi:hypothetical protein
MLQTAYSSRVLSISQCRRREWSVLSIRHDYLGVVQAVLVVFEASPSWFANVLWSGVLLLSVLLGATATVEATTKGLSLKLPLARTFRAPILELIILGSQAKFAVLKAPTCWAAFALKLFRLRSESAYRCRLRLTRLVVRCFVLIFTCLECRW